MKKFLWTLFAVVFIPSIASAAQITYTLDQSNALPDGVDYVDVIVSDGFIGGDVTFDVLVNIDEFNVANATNFGLQAFSFNYDITGLIGTPTIVNLNPSTWNVTNTNGNIGGFGKFDIDLSGTGSDRTVNLSFAITGVDGDTISNYAIGDNLYFAGHVAGFDPTPSCDGCTSAWFAGNDEVGDRGLDPPTVPVPAAAWLFGSGLIGLVGVARRRKD